jgi:MerR family transcriptional regulator, light-induced transcriptional regulator
MSNVKAGPAGARKTRAKVAAEPVSDLGFSIRVASKLTAIPPDTLRMWERRYGFPKPARRPGGSRLYSRDDVERLRLVAKGLDEGYRPHELVGKSKADLLALVRAAQEEAPARRAPAPLPAGTPTYEAAVDALTSEDARRLNGELRRAALALGPRGFVTDFAQPLARRIGDLWADGTIEIRQEHFLTECLMARIHVLLSAYEESTQPPVIVLATLPDEPHALGLAMVALYVATHGGTPRLLGANTPVSEIIEAAHAERADVVGLTATLASDKAKTRRAVGKLLEGLPRKTELWIGGDLAPQLAIDAANVRTVQTWAELDDALLASRKRGRG